MYQCVSVCIHVSTCMPACWREQVDGGGGGGFVRPGWTHSLSELYTALNEMDQ